MTPDAANAEWRCASCILALQHPQPVSQPTPAVHTIGCRVPGSLFLLVIRIRIRKLQPRVNKIKNYQTAVVPHATPSIMIRLYVLSLYLRPQAAVAYFYAVLARFFLPVTLIRVSLGAS